MAKETKDKNKEMTFDTLFEGIELKPDVAKKLKVVFESSVDAKVASQIDEMCSSGKIKEYIGDDEKEMTKGTAYDLPYKVKMQEMKKQFDLQMEELDESSEDYPSKVMEMKKNYFKKMNEMKKQCMAEMSNQMNEVDSEFQDMYEADENDEFIKETSLSRIKSKSDSGPMAIISASRGEMSPDENKRRKTQLVQDIMDAGLPGPARVVGRYVYSEPDNETETETISIPVKEDSLIVTPAEGMSPEEFEKILVSLGKKYNQESILIQSKAQGIGELIYTTGPKVGVREPKGTIHFGRTGDSYTQVKDKKDKDKMHTFTYENIMNTKKFPYNHVIDEAPESDDVVTDFFNSVDQLTSDIDIRRLIRSAEVDVASFIRTLKATMGDLKGNSLAEPMVKLLTGIFTAIANDTVVSQRISKFISTTNTPDLQPESIEIDESLLKTIDEYISYASEVWVEENKLEAENSLKVELAEEFLKGMKGLYENHNVTNLPTRDKTKEWEQKIEEAKEGYNKEIEKNAKLLKENKQLRKAMLIERVAEDLSDTQKEKFRKLAEEVKFEGEDKYSGKLQELKENFVTKTKIVKDKNVTNSAVLSEDIKPDPINKKMQSYVDALSRGDKF